MTVEEQDARLAAHTEKLRVENEIKSEHIRQLEELVEQQREFILELEETVARVHEKSQLLRQKKEALLIP